MMTVTFDLVGVSPISFSRAIQSVRNTGEAHDAFEERVWREKMHTMPNGEVFIPPQAVKNCLADCAKYLSETVPGKGKATYTKHFDAGVMCIDPILLGIKATDVIPERLFLPSDGKRGGGSRVWKLFPTLPTWRGHVTLHVFDPVLMDKPAKIEEYLGHAGKFIGLHRFRPRNGGFYGRFTIENFKATKG